MEIASDIKPLIEVAVDELEHAHIAERLGADRIELCANLSEGGTSPSYGLIRQTCQSVGIPVHVMVRPRPGNFCYSRPEMRIILDEIRSASDLGANGIVIGILDSSSGLHMHDMENVASLAHDLKLDITFHRAFDVCKDPWLALRQLTSLDVHRILTSGRELTAIEGIDFIEELVSVCESRIRIIAGSGVSDANARQLASTGVESIHFTCRKKTNETQDPMDFGQMWTFDDNKLRHILSAFE